MRDVYIINPAAGKLDSTEVLTEEIKKHYGNEAKIIVTEGNGDALLKARAEAETGDEVRIFACGGDGTCFEVLNGIVGYENASIGVVPIGSANDFIKYFGYDSKPTFLDISKQKNGTYMPIDLIKAGDKYCMNQCCAGFDARVADQMTKFKRLPLVSGSMAYNLSLIKNVLGRLGINIRVVTDGKEFYSGNALFAICANAPVYGGGYKSAPKARPDDGELDCVAIKTISRFRFLKLVGIYKRGEHEGIDVCSMNRCKEFELFADSTVPISLDGEIIYADHLKCEIVPKKINLIVPEGIY